jgi:hypothetical protein
MNKTPNRGTAAAPGDELAILEGEGLPHIVTQRRAGSRP